MRLQGEWLTRGYFDVKDPEGGSPLTQLVRASLANALGRKPRDIRLASYPVGPAWRYALWWREGDLDYAEAQFFAGLSAEYPILSVGVSLEKGLEGAAAAGDEGRAMDRSIWDWQRFVQLAGKLVETDLPECGRRLGRAVVVRLRASGRGIDTEGRKESRTFVYADTSWFERHKGRATTAEIGEAIRDLDTSGEWWVGVHLACDLTPAEVAAMTDQDLTDLLLEFAPVRRAIRSHAAA